MKTKRTIAMTAALTAGLCLPVLAGGPLASAVPAQDRPAHLAAEKIDEAPVFLREEYLHPDAERLGAELGIKLKDGNGKMIYVGCSTEGSLITVESSDAKNNAICFQSISSPAWLNMEITGSFGVKAGQNAVDVTSTLDGKQQKMTIPGNTIRAIGVAEGDSIVIQLKVN